ncbi:hypothetical protein OH491_17310 [Termitidicoccus mucosus]|uniref:hypothetical protein n=1 Tax=Termitidicoccus mucosus TaxID=1184151 RepID=UPI0011AB613D
MRIPSLFILAALVLPAYAASQPAIEVTFETKTAADNTAVPASTRAIRTLGFREMGIGPALYIYSGTAAPAYSPRGEANVSRPASHYIAAKAEDTGAALYYVLSEETPNVLQFGALADSTADGKSTRTPNTPAHDNTTAFNDALDFGKGVFVPAGRYWIAGTLRILVDGTSLYGQGPGGADQGGTELIFGPGTSDCIQLGDGESQLRWGKITRMALSPRLRTGGNAIFAHFNYQLVLAELRINSPYNGIRLFRGIGFMLKDIVMSGIRAGDGTADGPREIGYGIKFAGAPELYDKNTGKKVKRDTHVLYLENISFGSAKVETDPTNWTVGLWCAENAASVNGATIKNQNVRHGVYITRAPDVDPADRLLVPDGYRLVPAALTASNGKTYRYGSSSYPAEPGTIPIDNGHFQDLTLFYLGGDFLGGEYIYNDCGSGIAIYNPHFMRTYQGNAVYMGADAKDMSVYGGQVIGAYKHGFDMNGERWHISGVQIYRHSLDAANRRAHAGKYSAIHVGSASIGGDIVNCKIGNEPPGTTNRAGNTVRFGVDIEKGARSTWVQGNRFDGCIDANVNNQAGEESKAGGNLMGPTGGK